MTKKKSIALIINFISILLLIYFDQLTKQIARNNLVNNTKVLIKDVLELYFLENGGAAFGIMQGKQLFFLIITSIVLLAVLYFIWTIPEDKKYYKLYIVFDLIFAGGVGNMIDRISKSTVTDFIYFKIINFPVFNVADIYVTVSVVLLLILIFFVYKEDDLKFLSKNKDDKN